MKQWPKLTMLLIALAVILAALGAACGAAYAIATDATFYVDDSREAVAAYLGREVGKEGLLDADEHAVTMYIGLTREEQTAFASETARMMGEQQARFELDVLQAHEQQHMRDVRDLILLANRVAKMCMTAAAILALLAAWTGASLADRSRTGLLGAACGIGALAAIAGVFLLAMNTAGFERLFFKMHELLFTNRYWLLNPKTDILIRMMPQPLFERALVMLLVRAGRAFALVLAVLAAAYGLIGGMVRRNLTEGKQA